MRLFANSPASEDVLLAVMCCFALLLFLTASAIIMLMIRQKRYRWLILLVPIAIVTYFTEQFLDTFRIGDAHGEISKKLIERFSMIPDITVIAVLLAIAIVEALLIRSIYLREKRRITAMSVKEAMDKPPLGLLCYAPGARNLLVNQAMRDFCRKTTGSELINGEAFAARLRAGDILPECKNEAVGSEPVIVLEDGTAWSIAEQDLEYENHVVRILLAYNITESYKKSVELRRMQEELTALGSRLNKVNQEIVALTTEREVLNAKVKMHDEIGNNLLAIKRFILNEETDRNKAELISSLHRSVEFLLGEREASSRDEYALIIETAEKLGVAVNIDGVLPESEPQKHILAVAIHECCTNTLRHAHGNELNIRITTEGGSIVADFTNNGTPPAGELHERGGLASLRELIEGAGGSMSILLEPEFIIRIELPKEVQNAV
ncbi:MAG: hypothetical protein IKZ82_03475 [Clostridia bacterium]|nr:hypothetical protein [Clostridia bacterium]